MCADIDCFVCAIRNNNSNPFQMAMKENIWLWPYVFLPRWHMTIFVCSFQRVFCSQLHNFVRETNLHSLTPKSPNPRNVRISVFFQVLFRPFSGM